MTVRARRAGAPRNAGKRWRLRGWDVAEQADGVWWCAWRYGERISGTAETPAAAAAAIEHFFDA